MSLVTLSLDTVPLGLRASKYGFGEDIVQSIAEVERGCCRNAGQCHEEPVVGAGVPCQRFEAVERFIPACQASPWAGGLF